MKFDINRLAHNFEEISSALSTGRALAPYEREIMDMRITELHRFFSACAVSAKEVEEALVWRYVHRS